MQMEFDFREINLSDDWDVEVPGGIDEDVLVSPTGAECLIFEQELIVNDDSAEHRKVEMVDMDPFEELQQLIDDDNLNVKDEWPKSGDNMRNHLQLRNPPHCRCLPKQGSSALSARLVSVLA